MRSTVSLVLALGMAGCALAAAGDDEVTLDGEALLAGKADGDEHLRVQLPPVTLVPGLVIDGWRLSHSMVTANVDLTGLFSLEVTVRVPADFFVEVGSFLLYDLPAGARVTLAGDTSRWGGEALHLYVRRLPGGDEGRPDGIRFPPGHSASFVVEPTRNPIRDEAGVATPGTSHYLVLVLPAELRPGADHVMVDLRAEVR